MFISNNIVNYNSYNKFTPNKPQNISRFRDVSCTDTVCFTSNEISSVETRLKSISGLHDPYSNIIMLSAPEYKNYLLKIEKRPNALAMLNLLTSYEKNLFEPEKEACEYMKYKLDEYKKYGGNKKPISKLDFNDLLQDIYPEAKENLKNKQKNKVEEIQKYLSKAHGDTKENLTKVFDSANEAIENDTFRLAPLFCKVRELKGVDKEVKKNVLNLMQTFPNSKNSAEVFILNNKDKTHEEIAEALLSPSQSTIEHIKPQRINGPSTITNYLIASKRMNNLRNSESLSQFINLHPEIPSYTQRYFDDIVNKINRGGLKFLTPHLQDITDNLRRQSKGLIDIEITNISKKELRNNDIYKEKLDEFLKLYSK